VIRQSVPDDADWIRTVAAEVYAPLGDYGVIIPSWMAHPGVLTFVECDDKETHRRGFILIGFYVPNDMPRGALVADLLAIAVAAEHQRRGVGKILLTYAIDLARMAGERVPVPELRLTVADTNSGARKLFESFEFEVLDENHGSYDGGQRAIRMRHKLPGAGSVKG
jgi:ribosomal protein S18 acetylase RimI-like enzyme